MRVERAGSIGARLWFYKDPAMPLSSAARERTHAKMSRTNMHSTPHAVRARRGPHAYVLNREPQTVKNDSELLSAERNEAAERRIGSGSVYLLEHHEKPH